MKALPKKPKVVGAPKKVVKPGPTIKAKAPCVKPKVKKTEEKSNPQSNSNEKPVNTKEQSETTNETSLSNNSEPHQNVQKNSIEKSEHQSSEKKPNIQKEKPNSIQQINLPKISYLPCSISSLYDVEKCDLDEYSFSDSPILDFNGIDRFTNAHSIFITNALFTSFKNSVILPKLKKCSFSGSPISIRKSYRQMILFAFGGQIEEIDNTPVSEQEKKIFAKFDSDSRQLISNYIQNGGIVMRDFNDDLISELKCKQIKPPEIMIPVTQDSRSPNVSAFLTKNDISEYINANKRLNNIESKSVEQQKNQRILLSEIETEIFNGKNALPNQTKLAKICDKSEIEKVEREAFEIIQKCLIDISGELHSKIEMIEKFKSIPNFAIFASPTTSNINNCLTCIETIMSSLSNRSFNHISNTVRYSFKSSIKTKSCFSIIESYISKYFENISNQLYQFATLYKQKMIQTLEDFENIEQQIQNSKKLLGKAGIYLQLITKCPLLAYFVQFGQLCSESFQIFSKIELDQSSLDAKNSINNMFIQLLSFNQSVIDNYDHIKKLHEYLPNYSNIEYRLISSICESKSYIKKFENEKIDEFRQKLAQFDCDGSEFKEKWKETTNKIESALKFVIVAFDWIDQSGRSSSLMNDVGNIGEEYIVFRTNECENRASYQSQYDDLILEEEAKDAEIEKLLAQCAELGIEV